MFNCWIIYQWATFPTGVRFGSPCLVELIAFFSLYISHVPFILNTPINHGFVGDLHIFGTIWGVFHLRGMGLGWINGGDFLSQMLFGHIISRCSSSYITPSLLADLANGKSSMYRWSAWWFQTWLLWLSIQLGFYNPNWRTPSFFRGVGSTTSDDFQHTSI